jgi:hypothetical protein
LDNINDYNQLLESKLDKCNHKKERYLEESNYHKSLCADLKDLIEDLENKNTLLVAENENILNKCSLT